MKVRAIMDYKDFQLNKDIKVGDEYVVSKERAEVLLKGNASSKNKPFVELVKEVEVETADIKPDNIETATIKPKRKKVSKD